MNTNINIGSKPSPAACGSNEEEPIEGDTTDMGGLSTVQKNICASLEPPVAKVFVNNIKIPADNIKMQVKNRKMSPNDLATNSGGNGSMLNYTTKKEVYN